MNVTMLLCDAAEEVGGKLYILGGGWNTAVVAGPLNMALAILIEVPWDKTNKPMQVRAELVDEDGTLVKAGEQNADVAAEGQLEVGRPPGIKAGSALNSPIALKFQGVPLEAGHYSWVLKVDGNELARCSFSASSPQ